MGAVEGGIEEDRDIAAALEWLASVSVSPKVFWERLGDSQCSYRSATSLSGNFGKDLKLTALGDDVVGAFLAQSKSLLDDRRSYDLALGSQIVPWVKQIGKNVDVLDRVTGARERAAQMLHSHTVHPDSVIFELVMASNYAADDFDVAFVDETKGEAKTPDLRLLVPGFPEAISVECKRLQRGQYETNEQVRHKLLFREAAKLIDERHLSVHIDVTYTSELEKVPDAYLAERLTGVLSSPVVTLGTYPWRDEFGFGEVRPANLAAVRRDIRDSSLYFGTKLARLLCGRVVKESGYHLAAGVDPDSRDPRYIEAIHYGSIITWQNIAPSSIEKKARYVKSKLAEADQQLIGHGPAIVHVAMDAELQSQSSDLRRERNIDAIKKFRPNSKLMAIYLHYLVPRISEAHSWLIDETVDRFGPSFEPVPSKNIFAGSAIIGSDLPAWKLDIPPPR